MLSPTAQASVLLASLAVFALCLYVAWRIWRPAPHAPRDRFRFVESLAPALSDVGLVIREDVGPGGLFRIIAAGPLDTSPRAGAGHDVLADCNLQRTERASWLAQELAPASLRAIYDARLTIFAELNPGPGGGGHGARQCNPQECGRSAEACHGGEACGLGGFDPRDPLGVTAADCTAGECPTPSVCRQVGGCADAVPTVPPEETPRTN